MGRQEVTVPGFPVQETDTVTTRCIVGRQEVTVPGFPVPETDTISLPWVVCTHLYCFRLRSMSDRFEVQSESLPRPGQLICSYANVSRLESVEHTVVFDQCVPICSFLRVGRGWAGEGIYMYGKIMT